ncbi:hypothetical protein [Bergeyella sp. RCAD1439]|uniref:hypothetical protein n=1 Tax=Bergeyella anatis TaxID=3113737 RepID=UPI002E18429E|nr:hypothetical protein [Bergeyella sp. RCAD1439]
MSDKIEDNPSFKDFGKQLEGAKQVKKLISLVAPFSKKAKDILNEFEAFDKIQNDFDEISKSPDLFNKHFSDLGWIAHESMNHTLTLECIELADKGEIQLAEEKLAKYYTSEEMKWLISATYGTPEFRKRNNLINFAYQDTLDEKFYSAIPLILMVIDGTVNDIDKNKGFFTESTDLTAWDSIAAHSSGLTKLRDILNTTRKSTSTEEIFLPYRNGILHGRDISYANKYVCAKSWLTLFAINDWAKAKKKNIENPPKEKQDKTIKESLSDLKNSIVDYRKQQLKHREMNNYMDLWKSRIVEIGNNIPINGISSEYEEFSPERDVVKFLENWNKKNYGAIANQIDYYSNTTNVQKEAGVIRKILENKVLNNFSLISVNHTSPALCDVELKINFSHEDNIFDKSIKMRLIYKSHENENMVYGQKNGSWKFLGTYAFNEIQYP